MDRSLKKIVMPLLSSYSSKKKIEYFLKRIPKQAKILEVGCGANWVGDYLKKNGWAKEIGIDIVPPADIVGSILNWRELGLKEESFDYIIAFETTEHLDCFKECYTLLKPGGQLMITSPLPHMDWFMKLLELVGLNQKRTSPHGNLVYLKNVPYFRHKDIKIVSFLTQWAIFTKDNS